MKRIKLSLQVRLSLENMAEESENNSLIFFVSRVSHGDFEAFCSPPKTKKTANNFLNKSFTQKLMHLLNSASSKMGKLTLQTPF